MNWFAAFVSVIGSVAAALWLYVQKRRLITPPIDIKTDHSIDGKYTSVTLYFGRLEKWSYSLDCVMVVGKNPEKIIAVSDGLASKPKLIKPESKINLAIDIKAAIFAAKNEQYACQLSLIMEKPNKPTALRIAYKTSFLPFFSWHELKIFPENRMQF